ncbi:MAG: hypothetical protein LBE20_05010 [Deltaproteobacteria bacterium]|jgi:phosphoribosylformylglycinamidine synthase|nr:hypothetical protein [Deltaproteobacteria bacterium]
MATIILKKKELPFIDFEYAKVLGLDQAEWQRILTALGRFPNEYECLIFALNWSEENVDKTSRTLRDSLSQSQKAVFGNRVIYSKRLDNKFVDLGRNQAITMSIAESNLETTNSLSLGPNLALDKIIDNLIVTATEPLAFMDMLRLGDPEMSRTHKSFQKIINTLSKFTNTYGVPIAGGDLYFHKAFNDTLCINLGAVGVTETNYVQNKKAAPPPGSPILFLGTKLPSVWVDGAYRSAFQIADPFQKQRFLKLILQALKEGLLEELFPLNKGGIACAAARMATHFNSGVQLYVDKVPTEAKKFSLENVLLNNPLGNFLAVAHPDKHREVSDFFTKNSITLTTVGFLADIDDLELIANHLVWAAIPYRTTTTGFSRSEVRMTKAAPMLRRAESQQEVYDPDLFRDFTTIEDAWIDIVTNPNLCSRNVISKAFDKEAGLRIINAQGADAAVALLPNPDGGPQRALGLTMDSNCLYSTKDSYLGTLYSMLEAVQNLTAVGAKPLGVSYCLNVSDPNDPIIKIQMSEVTRAVDDTSIVLDIPVLSEAVIPIKTDKPVADFAVPSILMTGLIEDVTKVTKHYFEQSNELVFVIGVNRPLFLASEYLYYIHKKITGSLPELNLAEHSYYCNCVRALIKQGLVKTVHDISLGGLALALSECCVYRPKRAVGVELEIFNDPVLQGLRAEVVLFNESLGRFILSVSPEKRASFLNFCQKQELNIFAEGLVGGRDIKVTGLVNFSMPVSTIKRTWLNGLNYMFNLEEQEDM